MNALSSSSSCGLSAAGRCHSYECSPGLMILRLMIGSCPTNAGWCYIRFNGPEPGVTWFPDPWRRCHTGPGCSTVVCRWIGTCSATEELKAGGWCVCVSGGWSVRRRTSSFVMQGLQEMYNVCCRHHWSNASRFLASCQVGDHVSAPYRMTGRTKTR